MDYLPGRACINPLCPRRRGLTIRQEFLLIRAATVASNSFRLKHRSRPKDCLVPLGRAVALGRRSIRDRGLVFLGAACIEVVQVSLDSTQEIQPPGLPV